MTDLRPSSPVRIPAPLRTRTRVVELVGVAGAGKTSLLRAIGQRDTTLLAGLRPPRRRHLAHIVPLLPTFLGLHWPYRGLHWKEMKRILYLRTLEDLLQAELPRRPHTVVLDEGPIYILARLRVYGGERIRTPSFDRWWRRALQRWARAVDVVVWLDAPDAVLTQRLRTRNQAHRLRGLSDEVVGSFLALYREAYETVVGSFAAVSGLQVLKVRTDGESVGQIAARVTAELQAREDGGQ